MNYEIKHIDPSPPPRGEHGLHTVGACVACATPLNPAPAHLERAEDLSP
jgi:hypothetical protein